MLAPIGKIIDRDIASGTLHYMLIVLVSTMERSFLQYVKLGLEAGKALYVDFEFPQHHLRCVNCFEPEHSTRDCMVRRRGHASPIWQRPTRQIAPLARPIATSVVESFQSDLDGNTENPPDKYFDFL